MFKNLNFDSLGITGRQSEQIELALSFGFRGLDLDLESFVKQAQTQGLDKARRYLDSAHIKLGTFRLPVRWQEDDTAFKADMAQLSTWAETAAAVGVAGCVTTIQPASDRLPYHENFEMHRKRFADVADALTPHSIRLGLEFQFPAHHRAGRQFQFVSDVEGLLLLAKTVGSPNVGVVVDLWHWHFGGGTLEQLRQLRSEQIVAVNVADAPEDADPQSVTEESILLPGKTGVIDAAAWLTALSRLGYRGPVTPVVSPTQTKGMTREAIVRAAGESLTELWKTAGISPSGRASATAGK